MRIFLNKEELLKELEKLNFPVGDYYLLSSGCLMLYGLRDKIDDIDLCISEELFEIIKDKYDMTEDKKNYGGFYQINDYMEIVVNKKEDLVYDMKDGIPVEKLETIVEELKDETSLKK